MLEVVKQFELHNMGQIEGSLGSLVATPSLLSRVIESHGQDAEILSTRDQIQSDTSNEGWVIHTNGNFGIGDMLWFPSQQI